MIESKFTISTTSYGDEGRRVLIGVSKVVLIIVDGTIVLCYIDNCWQQQEKYSNLVAARRLVIKSTREGESRELAVDHDCVTNGSSTTIFATKPVS